MEERNSEIKSAFDHLFDLLDNENKELRAELEELKRQIASMSMPAPKEHTSVSAESTSAPDESASVAAESTSAPEETGPKTIVIGNDDTPFELSLRSEKEDKSDNHTIIGELFSDEDSVVHRAMTQHAWEVDIPGSKINDVISAMTLNDRVVFARVLFDDDQEQMDLTLERINETGSFKEVLFDMRAAFPEWDESSDEVYRFYMMVRRLFV